MTTIVTQSLFRCLDLIELKAHCDTKCWIICQCCLRRSAIANTVKETLPQTSFSFFLSFFWPCKIWVGNLNFLSELLVTTFLKCVSKKGGGGVYLFPFFFEIVRGDFIEMYKLKACYTPFLLVAWMKIPNCLSDPESLRKNQILVAWDGLYCVMQHFLEHVMYNQRYVRKHSGGWPADTCVCIYRDNEQKRQQK